jgi:predicted nucleic acid-binding Zn ribbon protein
MERKSCKYCGAPLPEDALFCPFCEKEQIEKLQLRAPRPGRRRTILAALLALALLAGGLGLWRGSLRHEPQVYNAGAPVAEMQYTAGDGVNYRLFLSFAGPGETEPCERIHLSLSESGEGSAVSLLCAVPEGGTPEEGAAFLELVDHTDILAAELQGSDALEHGEPAYDPQRPFAAAAVTLRYDRHCWLNELGWVLTMKNGDVLYLHQYVYIEDENRVSNAGAPAVEMWYTAEDGVRYRLFLSAARTAEDAKPCERVFFTIPERGRGRFITSLCAVPEGGTLAEGAAFAGQIKHVEIRVGTLPDYEPPKFEGVPRDGSRPFAAASVAMDYDERWRENELSWVLRMKNGDLIYLHQFVFVENGA